jgi:colanic acid biosynthesis glycosyl transferase WcaI
MKIIFINRYFYPDESATSQILTDLAFYLSDQNYNVHIITSRQRYDNASAKLPSIDIVRNVKIYRIWTSRFGRYRLPGRFIDFLSFYVCAVIKLFIICSRDDVIIAKTDPPMLSIPVRAIARLRNAKQINWLQDLFPEVAMALGIMQKDSFLGKWLIKSRNSSLKNSDLNVVIGERVKERLINEGVPEDKISVIHNWADGSIIRPLSGIANPLLEQWEIAGKFIVTHSGNLGRVHDYETVIDAAKNLQQEQDIVFLFIGGGVKLEKLAQEVFTRGLENFVFKHYQPRESLRYSLGIADVHLIVLNKNMTGLIVPSKFYGISAAGKPVIFIGDSNGEIPEIIISTGSGMIVEQGDAGKLAESILKLKNDADLRKKMGLNARTVFDKRFSPDIALSEWEKTLQRVGAGP